ARTTRQWQRLSTSRDQRAHPHEAPARRRLHQRGRARVLARDLRLQSAPLRFYAQTLSPTARHEQASAGNRLYVSSRAMTYEQAKRARATCSGPFRCSLVCSSSRFLHLLVLAQEFERLLELRIFGLLLGRGSFGRNLVLVSGLRLRA